MQIADAMRRDYDALRTVQSVQAQLKETAPRAQTLAGEIGALEQKLAALDGGGTSGPRRAGGGQGLAQLNGALRTIFEGVDSADAAPTTSLVAAFDEAGKSLEEQLQRWNAARSDVEALNQKLRQARLPLIILEAGSGRE
jgi:uncharacterized phage infection (PIP) family protein YhgE